MNKDLLIKISFGISLFSSLAFAASKILHLSSNVGFLWPIALISTIIYTILIAIEIFSSSRVTGSEKVMWTVGLIFFNTFAGLLYFVSPLDFVPDFIFGLGFIDDVYILTLVYKQVAKDLEKYRLWKERTKQIIHI